MTTPTRIAQAARAGVFAVLAAAACHRASPAATASSLPRIPRDAARFEIERASDSTVVFQVREARWIHPGAVAYAVDPMQRDALIAQLRIVTRDSVNATAVVTSQVSWVRVSHALLVPRLPAPWWRRGLFWSGAGVGAAVGVGVMSVAR